MSIKKHLMMTYHGERLSFVALLHARLNGVDSAGGIMAGGARVQFAEAINLLGVTLDQTLSMDRHVANIAQSCSYHTRALRHIMPVLSLDCAKDIATSIVGT